MPTLDAEHRQSLAEQTAQLNQIREVLAENEYALVKLVEPKFNGDPEARGFKSILNVKDVRMTTEHINRTVRNIEIPALQTDFQTKGDQTNVEERCESAKRIRETQEYLGTELFNLLELLNNLERLQDSRRIAIRSCRAQVAFIDEIDRAIGEDIWLNCPQCQSSVKGYRDDITSSNGILQSFSVLESVAYAKQAEIVRIVIELQEAASKLREAADLLTSNFGRDVCKNGELVHYILAGTESRQDSSWERGLQRDLSKALAAFHAQAEQHSVDADDNAGPSHTLDEPTIIRSTRKYETEFIDTSEGVLGPSPYQNTRENTQYRR